MVTITISDARKSFHELLGRVEFRREEVILLRRGKPAAKVVPIDTTTSATAVSVDAKPCTKRAK